MKRLLARFAALASLAFALALCGVATPAWAGPPPIDPKNMSGIPRPDPNVPSGTITVRVLGEGGFADPQVGVDVTLDIRGIDGKTQSVVEKTVDAGRATFTGLDAFKGGTAVARAELGGKTVKTLPIDILPGTGSRVMLVQGAPDRPGAGGPAAGGPGHGQPAGPSIPTPGTAFPLEGQPAGTLTVGTFDLKAKKPISGVEVTLTIELPQGPPVVKVLSTDAGGKVLFENLVAPEVPAEAKLTVEATLVPGSPQRKSQPFSMSTAAGMAVVLAEGAENFDPNPQPPPTAGMQRRPPVPTPKVLRSLQAGTVKVRIVDPGDKPLPQQPMTLVKKTAGGGVTEIEGVTDATGAMLFENVGVQQDALYFVQTVYGGGPYQSRFFGMDRRGGVSVVLRVFPTTSDRSLVKSAVQYDVDELENDKGQVVQIYEVMVQGDKAFWDPELKIEGMPGAHGFTVLRPAEPFLDHDESAPFATLHGPIPPGEVVNLSVGYLLDHEGSIRIDWEPPFEVVEGNVLVGETFTLNSPGSEQTDAKSQIPDKVVYKLDTADGVHLEMEGLRIGNPIYRQIGLYGGVGLVVIVLLGFMTHNRGTPKQRLLKRRDELLAMLEKTASDSTGSSQRERILSALDRVYRQLGALEAMHAPPAAKSKPNHVEE